MDEIGIKEGMSNRKQLQNIHQTSIFSNLYTDEVDHEIDDSCSPKDNQKYTDKGKDK